MPTLRPLRRCGDGLAGGAARRAVASVVFVAALIGLGGGSAALASDTTPGSAPSGASANGDAVRIPTREAWSWPVARPFLLDRPFEAPVHDYGPGHRGIDILPSGSAVVTAPAGGVVAFSGVIAGRGIVTIDHGDGLVTTLEPVTSDLRAGTAVTGGDDIGELSLGGHAAPGRLHFGVRWNGEYVNPLLLLDGVPRAILLPCC